ncbi:MAG TPA: PKD domain-containing protein, partial [Planctomycetota bacterium]|nr:PKD domain-containing protein [Planctomycetota bacterium]
MTKAHRSGGHSAWAVAVAVCLALLALCPPTAAGKSLYVIKDLNDDGPVQAYDIGLTPGSPVLQRESGPIGFGPVGMAVDDASGTLFITIEGKGAVWLMDAVTLRMLGSVATPGACNLAGVAFDSATQQLYAVDRNSNQLYVYTWDAMYRVLAYYQTVALPEVSGAMGLAWDEANGLLLVADATTTVVRGFYPGDWTEACRFSITQKPMGIAIDRVRRLVYTGNALIAKGQPALLSQYDLNTGSERVFNLRTLPGLDAPSDCVVGLAVDTGTGCVYITTGNQISGGTSCLMVFDTSLNLLYTSPRLGNPTGLCIPNNGLAYNPLRLANNDGVPPGGFVLPGGQITYTLSYDNLTGASPVNNVVLTDALSPGTAFLSASGGGTYDPATHTVTWSLGQLPAGAPRASQTVLVRVTASGGALLRNRGQITSTETGPAFATALTPVGGNDMAPVAIAGADQRVEQTSAAGASVTLDASGSYDPEGEHLTYLWSWAGGNETGPHVTRTFPLGTTAVTLVVNDGTSTSEPDIVTVTVAVTTPPRLTAPAD